MKFIPYVGKLTREYGPLLAAVAIVGAVYCFALNGDEKRRVGENHDPRHLAFRSDADLRKAITAGIPS
jgi:hypothetical protein